jgi:hypothetical protein
MATAFGRLLLKFVLLAVVLFGGWSAFVAASTTASTLQCMALGSFYALDRLREGVFLAVWA